jgi:hypothetical protein
MLKNENNYSSTSTLALTNVNTVSGQDIQICWGDLLKDLQCHDVAPATDVKNVSLVRLPKQTQTQANVTLISGNLSLTKGDVDMYREHHTNGTETCTNLSTMNQIADGPAIVVAEDYVERSADTYVIIASNTVTPGIGARSMVFVTPKASGGETTVNIPNGCGLLDFKANMHTLTKVPVSKQGPWVVDWSQVSKDSENKDINLPESFDLILAFYENKSVTDIESDFFNVDRIATKLWRVTNITIGTTSKSLGLAQDAQGNLFTGFESLNGVWAVGLQCPGCQNPAPMFLTVLDPIGGDQ